MLKTITVIGQGKTTAASARDAGRDRCDGSISYYAKQAQPHRWLAFRAVNSDGLPENALPAASSISVTVEKGTPSAEGPLTTVTPQAYSFQTYSPLKFNGGYCGWRENKNCSPFESWYLEFNNSIDASKFTKEMIKIEPAVDGLKYLSVRQLRLYSGLQKRPHDVQGHGRRFDLRHIWSVARHRRRRH